MSVIFDETQINNSDETPFRTQQNIREGRRRRAQSGRDAPCRCWNARPRATEPPLGPFLITLVTCT